VHDITNRLIAHWLWTSAGNTAI